MSTHATTFWASSITDAAAEHSMSTLQEATQAAVDLLQEAELLVDSDIVTHEYSITLSLHGVTLKTVKLRGPY
jgi:hypothetical protein